MHIFGGCFPFIIFQGKNEEAGNKKKRLAEGKTTAKGRCAVKSQQSKHNHKAEQTKTTQQTFTSRASHFSKPQNMSDKDRVWAQAFRFGCRWFKLAGFVILQLSTQIDLEFTNLRQWKTVENETLCKTGWIKERDMYWLKKACFVTKSWLRQGSDRTFPWGLACDMLRLTPNTCFEW